MSGIKGANKKAKLSSDKVIITCAITGAETTSASQPNLPVTPAQQAMASKEVLDAGGSIIHLHVREDDGKPSQRPERFKESIDAIRKACGDVIIQISTGGAVGETIEKRTLPLKLKPEMASLNLGTMNFGEEVFQNLPSDIRGLAQAMKDLSITPELEVYEVGMLEYGFKLIEKGLIDEPAHVQFVLGVPGGMSGDPRNLVDLVSRIPSNWSWGVAGVGRFQLPLAVQALSMGGNIRVGFEDNIYYSKGVLAQSNAQLVARISRIAREIGREPASPAEVRSVLS